MFLLLFCSPIHLLLPLLLPHLPLLLLHDKVVQISQQLLLELLLLYLPHFQLLRMILLDLLHLGMLTGLVSSTEFGLFSLEALQTGDIAVKLGDEVGPQLFGLRF